MSYPPPSGFTSKSSSSTPQPPSSLPPRPPPSSNALPSSFKPAFSPGGPQNGTRPAAPSAASAFTAFAPRSVASSNFRSTTSTPPTYSAPAVTSYSSRPQQAQSYQSESTYYQPQQYGSDQSFSIRNPFPLLGQESSSNYSGFGGRDAQADPELEAQIAQWQSAYMSKDTDNSKPGFRSSSASTTGANTAPLGPSTRTEPSTTTGASTKDPAPKTVVRSGGGQTWQDNSLLEWDPAHFRIFVGNLAGEVTDDSLLKAFSKYPSVQKARVVRDKRTTKSKGYGFVSFSDGDEFFRAARDMQGKYIGSHPVILRRSTTEIKASAQKDERRSGKHGKGGGGHGGGKAGMNGKVERGGVEKRLPAKTKGGLKILG